MQIISQKDREKWNSFAKANGAPFAQSFEWGEVLLREGGEVDFLCFVENNEVVAQALVEYKKLPFGARYVFCPKGPVFSASANTQSVYNELEKFLKDKCLFARIEPAAFPRGEKFVKAKDVNPSTTIELDLTLSEAELLSQMKKNTRYSIRFSQSHGVEIKECIDVEKLWSLLKSSSTRDGFSLHFKKHYASVLKYPDVWQLIAHKDDKPIAVAVFIGFGNSVTYLFAGLDYNAHKFLAPYLLRWQAIKNSKMRGYKKMDFFGIAPGEMREGKYIFDKKHQYAGITQFKLGFGGKIKQWPGTFDFVFNKNKYRLYGVLRSIRRLF